MTEPQRYLATVHGRDYVVSVAEEGWSRRVALEVDGQELVSRKTSEERLTLKPSDKKVAAEVGKVTLRLSGMGRVRRATLVRGDLRLDLDPEPGSKAALREEKARERPKLYAARHVLEGMGSVVWLLVGGLIVAFVWRLLSPLVPDVDLPRPDVDLPDLPSIPWPDWSLPDVTPPAWVRWLMEQSKFVSPILIGIALAVYEVRRRRRQDELKRRLREGEAQDSARDDVQD